MWAGLKTLRFKLALLYLAVFGSLLVALVTVILIVRQQDIQDTFDERLSDRAEAIVEKIDFCAENSGLGLSTQRTRPRLIPYRLPGYYFQLRLEDGTIVERSANLSHVVLPLTEAALRSRQTKKPVLDTLADEISHTLLGDKSSMRLLTLYHDREGVDPFYLQIAVSTERVHASVRQLAQLLFCMVCVGTLLAAILSYLLAKRSLAPIRQIAIEAREMSPAHLDRRLPLPPGRGELYELTTTLNDMLDRLEAVFRAQEHFLTNAAHELKTPVAVMLGEAQVLGQKGRTPEEYDRFVANVQDEMRRLGQIINSMLILARADAGLPLTAVVPVSVNEIIMEAVTRCQLQAERQEIRLVPILAMPEPDRSEPVVQGDPELLRAAIANLIRNAIRYSPVQEAVDVSIQSDDETVLISVRDRGPGVPEDLKEQLFERFYSSSESDDSFKGIGLGLAIAKGVATLHRGAIDVSNHPEGGAEFVIELPLTTSDNVLPA